MNEGQNGHKEGSASESHGGSQSNKGNGGSNSAPPPAQAATGTQRSRTACVNCERVKHYSCKRESERERKSKKKKKNKVGTPTRMSSLPQNVIHDDDGGDYPFSPRHG